MFGRFGPVMDFGETIWTPGQIAWRLGLCFLMAGVPLAAVAVLALAISVFSRSLFGAVGFAIGFWITLMLVQELLAGIWTIGGFDMAELLFTRNLDISLRVAEMLSSGATAPWSQPGLVFAMASAAAWAVALFLASWARFHWQDLNK
ncbi:MAG: hypothetical protein BWZ10_01423 [candidate division BRC1 bacterium ADurb.BinA364]|nr:MAG: hypothetical protein BWZ10_01423 [candidate division BRC1 bacterium ADurb.BinA364]